MIERAEGSLRCQACGRFHACLRGITLGNYAGETWAYFICEPCKNNLPEYILDDEIYEFWFRGKMIVVNDWIIAERMVFWDDPALPDVPEYTKP